MSKPMRKVVNNYITVCKNSVGAGEIYIAGYIADEKWYEEDVTPLSIVEALDDMGFVSSIDMFITSYGGSIKAGNAIVNLLDKYKEEHNVTINAYISAAASMATGIAMAADKVYMYANGEFMIHKPLTVKQGNADDMRKTAELLDMAEETLIVNYRRKFKGSIETLKELMAKETNLSADEALAYGFVDEVIEPMQIAASSNGIRIGNIFFDNEEIVNKFRPLINTKGGKHKMKYNDALNEKYGITEEKFNGLEDVSELVALIEEKAAQDLETANSTIKELEGKVETAENSAEESNKLASELQEKLDAVPTEPDEELTNKATQFDKIKAEKVKDTLDSGLKAMGPTAFDNVSWKTTLENMDYDKVCDLQNTWDMQAKAALNAGNSVSVPQQTIKMSSATIAKTSENYNV